MTKRVIHHIRKEQFVRRVRYIGGLTIYFRDKDAILIADNENWRQDGRETNRKKRIKSF